MCALMTNGVSATRTIRLTTGAPERMGEACCLAIVDRGKEEHYTVTEVRVWGARAGRCFMVAEEYGPTYVVEVLGRQQSCQCSDWRMDGKCRHASGLTALIRARKLPELPVSLRGGPGEASWHGWAGN